MATSARVAAVLEHAHDRQARERRTLRLLGLPLLLAVVVPSLSAGPGASLHGDGLVVSAALAALVGAFVAVLVRAPRLDRGEGGIAPTVASLVVMAGAGVVLGARQPSGTGQLALCLVSWVAGARLPVRGGAALVGAATAANVVVLALDASLPATAISSSLLLAALLFLMARLYRRAHADRQRAEIATAELQDARERELQSAALAERSRIARELHDVLAHSLSGLSLQLEAARLTAEQEGTSARLSEILQRCRRLAGHGLADARRAVQLLRDERMPGLEGLGDLVEGFRQDGLEVGFSLHGEARALRPEAGLALFRAVQEALTNVVRHGGGAPADVEVRVDDELVRVVITNGGDGGPAAPILAGAGSGYGLSAMRERAELLGGTVRAGPTEAGFRVELELPA